MKIQARFMGVMEGSLVHKEGAAEFPAGITVKEFFKKADKALGLSPTPCFKMALKQKIPPAVMINGNPIILPDDLDHLLRDGDEISVLLPMAGG